MGGQSGDQTTVSTSIALLQERFRQLQKTREKREERALFRMLSESEQIMPATSFEPARISSQNDAIFPSRPPHQHSLSLGLELYSNPTNFRSMKTPPPVNLWSNVAAAAAAVSPSYTSDNSDVDTTLHL